MEFHSRFERLDERNGNTGPLERFRLIQFFNSPADQKRSPNRAECTARTECDGKCWPLPCSRFKNGRRRPCGYRIDFDVAGLASYSGADIDEILRIVSLVIENKHKVLLDVRCHCETPQLNGRSGQAR